MNLFEEIVRLSKENETFAVATILESKGSTPRHLGKMIVKRDGSILGTVGGGLAEAMVIGEAKKAIARGQSTIVDYTLNSEAQGGLNML
jgi:xanthine dehydrogenase accessory factor